MRKMAHYTRSPPCKRMYAGVLIQRDYKLRFYTQGACSYVAQNRL